jgi:hypothetical protein
MTRGGKREGAGGKSRWVKGKTKVIRVPEALADIVLQFAEFLDSAPEVSSVTWSISDDVTRSKSVDLSKIAVRSFNGNPCVYLSDLLRVGYQIYPERLANSVKVREGREDSAREQNLRNDVQSAIQQLSILKVD